MELKEIIKTLMLSELYFNMPLGERKEVVWRLWAQYGRENGPRPSPWPGFSPAPSRSDDSD